VSLTPPKNLSAVSLTRVNNFSSVSLTPAISFTFFGFFPTLGKYKFFTGVVDTAEQLITGDVDTGEYLGEFSKKFKKASMEYLGAWGTLIHEKNLKSKISCQTTFKQISYNGRGHYRYRVLLTITGVQVLAFVHDVAGNHAAGWQPCCWLAPMLLLASLHQDAAA
jgi:hypothetical protein